MTENILDEIEKPNNKIYYAKSKKSLKIAFSLVLISSLIIFVSLKIKVFSELISSLGAIMFLIAVIISFTGVINGVKSYLKHEENSADRFLILLGNLIISGIFILMIVANILDFIRFLNE